MKSKVWTIVLSAVIAFGLWMYVITVERTETEQTFYNVPVILDGESVLQERGLKITSDKDLSVTLKLSGNRSALNKLRSSDITVLVDLTRIYEAGEKSLSYDVLFPGDIQNSAIEIVNRKPDNISLTVAEWDTKSIPVEADPIGTPAPGYLIDEQNMTTDYKTVTISGPKNLIAQIHMAKVTVDMTGKTEKDSVERTKLTLCDEDGEPVVADLSSVVVDRSMIMPTIPLLKEKLIRLEIPIIPGGGLTKEAVWVDFKEITVVGSPAVISKMEDFIPLDPINLTFARESYTKLVDIPLPEGVRSREGNKVRVTVTVPEDMETKTFDIPNSQFVVDKTGEFKPFDVEFTTKVLTVTIRGKVGTGVEDIDIGSISVIVDLANKLADGSFAVRIEIKGLEDSGIIGAVEDPDNRYGVFVKLKMPETGG